MLTNNFESMAIKRNRDNTYSLYGLMWHEFEQNGERHKGLVSVKSDNLKWNCDMSYEENYDIVHASKKGVKLISFMDNITRRLLYNFSFENIHSNDVMIELTILNKGEDEYMKYNIYEGLENYIVKVNVAGIKKENLKISLEDGVIRIKANPKLNKMEDYEVKKEDFKPSKEEAEIYLPNVESVFAKLEDGILILDVPKVNKGVNIAIA